MKRPLTIGRHLAVNPEPWQMRLLNSKELARFCKERGLKLLSPVQDRRIKALWKLGLISADLIISPRRVRLVGLHRIEDSDLGRHVYVDERIPRRRRSGFTNVFADVKVPPDLKLLFHPFRYYTVYQIERILNLHIQPLQMLQADRYGDLLTREIDHFSDWSSEAEFPDLIYRWNTICTIAIATEPCFFTKIFRTIRYGLGSDVETQQRFVKNHWEIIKKNYQELGVEEVRKFCDELCFNADLLDNNHDVYRVLRLGKGTSRLKVRSKLGGAIILRTMSEILRRAAEEAFNMQFPEEDELGLGLPSNGIKESLYGAERLFDGDQQAAREYVREYGLDYGVRVRWYVEGFTEYGALNKIFESNNAIELINLKGKVVQRGGKGVAFRENLKLDSTAGIFSFISIDTDNEDYVRVIRDAAENEEVFGLIFFADPDFEFHNFDIVELEEILWNIADENGAQVEARESLHNAIQDCTTGEYLLREAKRLIPELRQVAKGIDWGEKLIEYAWNNREIERPIHNAIQNAIRAASVEYHVNRARYKIDPQSGELKERE